MAEVEISQFLTHLARDGRVAASTQNQALSAILFLYKEVLGRKIGWLEHVERAKSPVRVPVVLTRDEVHKLFAQLHGTHRLMAGLLYGSGLRLMECVRLRVKGCRFWLRAPHRARWQGRQGQGHDVAGKIGTAAGKAFPKGEGAARGRSEAALRRAFAPRRWRGNFRTRRRNGFGSMCVLRGFRSIRDPAASNVITLTRARQVAVRKAALASAINKPATCHTCGILSRRICWRTATTSARSRSYWVTRMSARR